MNLEVERHAWSLWLLRLQFKSVFGLYNTETPGYWACGILAHGNCGNSVGDYKIHSNTEIEKCTSKFLFYPQIQCTNR